MALVRACAASLLAFVASLAIAQGSPGEPVRLLVGFAAGGGTDVVARLIAEPETRARLAALGQEVAPRSAADTRSFVARESDRYRAVAEAARITAQ